MLRQKLLVDCIRIRMGTDQWEELSQNEKQQKVMTLDAQAVEQIKIGKGHYLLLLISRFLKYDFCRNTSTWYLLTTEPSA